MLYSERLVSARLRRAEASSDKSGVAVVEVSWILSAPRRAEPLMKWSCFK